MTLFAGSGAGGRAVEDENKAQQRRKMSEREKRKRKGGGWIEWVRLAAAPASVTRADREPSPRAARPTLPPRGQHCPPGGGVIDRTKEGPNLPSARRFFLRCQKPSTSLRVSLEQRAVELTLHGSGALLIFES